ncbi:hypothetical protein CIPAW_02G090800 [Carya illinoinensis]|uniref:Uncharacterized protein n=1 Tax=Carya illinoinensis TaxID=32201 RepID=A0A8T1RCW9_CARIL|nr:hypothetical protein CIPAW_02G090800 [Carya illinoinensis]
MTQKSKKFNLAKDSSGIRDMFKDVIYFFNRDLLSSVCVICRANNAIASFTNYFLNSVPAPLTIFCEKVHIHRLHHHIQSYNLIKTMPLLIYNSMTYVSLPRNMPTINKI